MNYKNALLKDLTQVPSYSNISTKNLPMTSIINLSSTAITSKSPPPNVPVGTMNPPMGYTENNSATFLSSCNPCLDFFYHVVPDTPPSQLVQRLKSSWDHDPLTTLKLLCNLRGVRGTGKTDKEGFYTSALWLHEHHPKTLACNVPVIASFGYFKDFLEILFRIIQSYDARSKLKQEWDSRKSLRGRRKMAIFVMSRKERLDHLDREMKKSERRAQVPREVRIDANNAKVKRDKEKARILRKKTEIARARRVQELYKTDMDYRFLHEQIATFFANLLKADMECLNSGKAENIRLAGKWCPTIDSSYDKYTLICSTIARKMFPRESYPEYEGIGDGQYVYKIRDRLRKQVLVPLHKALKLPEVYMSARKWKLLPYNRVASVAMTKYTKTFMDRDKERFSQYLEKVKQGKAKIAAGALLPHDITTSCVLGKKEERTVAELLWKRMVDDMLQKGKLTNCIAICDVSGSMGGTPITVAIALGLLVSELSEEPWKGHVITFSEYPQLHLIEGSTVREKTQFMRYMNINMNTDFQKVFDKILEVAVGARLSEDQMIQRVFVFSDMEFDQALLNPWETDYMVIQRKFRDSGYQNVPEIVFWNLRNSSATPVRATQKGVATLSGYSKNMLTHFLEGGGEINPEIILEAATSGEEYQKLVVYD